MNLLFPIASLGVINGIIVAGYTLSKRRSTVSEIYFAGIVLAFCIRIGKSVILYYSGEADPLIKQIGLSACIFIGPLFYLYLKSLESNAVTADRNDKLLLLTLATFILALGIVFPYRSFPEYWNPEIVQVIYAIWALFLVLGLGKAYKVLGINMLFPWKLEGDRRYLSGIVIAVLLITITYQSALYVASFTYIWGAFIFSGSFYLLGLRALLNKSIAVRPKPKKVDGAKQLMEKLDRLMHDEQPFKNPALKLDDLATELDVSRHIMSQVLNEYQVGGYANYIRKFRIEEAKRLIATEEHLSLEGIGYEAGFRSKSSFFDAFKKIMHCTPAAYKKQLSKESGTE